MKITGLQKESYVDYPGKISAVVFTPGCNYKCPTCHAKDIIHGNQQIKEDYFFNYLDKTKDWIEGGVVCGGEPTQQLGLIPFIRKLKEKGLAVKLDTNGSNYGVLLELKKEKLVDYVAMDVKAPIHLYPQVVGKEYIDLRDDLQKPIGVVSQFPDYEFRTTVVPIVREDGNISFMTVKEVKDIVKFIYETTGTNNHKYFLQPFIARSKDEMIDEKFGKENLPKHLHETPKELLEEMLEKVIKYLPNAKIR